MKTEFSEVLSEIIRAHFPDCDKVKVNDLVNDILDKTGRLDYRYLYEALAWDHCKCLKKLSKLSDNAQPCSPCK